MGLRLGVRGKVPGMPRCCLADRAWGSVCPAALEGWCPDTSEYKWQELMLLCIPQLAFIPEFHVSKDLEIPQGEF